MGGASFRAAGALCSLSPLAGSRVGVSGRRHKGGLTAGTSTPPSSDSRRRLLTRNLRGASANTDPAKTAQLPLLHLSAEESRCISLTVIARQGVSSAFLPDLVERQREAFERIHIGAHGPFGGRALDHKILAFAHGFDQLGLLGGILHPSAVRLGIHRIVPARDFNVGVAVGLEPVTEDDRNLILDLFGRPGGNEHVRRIARPVGRQRGRIGWLGKCKTDLFASRTRRIGAPVAILPKQGRLRRSCSRRRYGRSRRRLWRRSRLWGGRLRCPWRRRRRLCRRRLLLCECSAGEDDTPCNNSPQRKGHPTPAGRPIGHYFAASHERVTQGMPQNQVK